ncbi:MAG: 50S ribosomal protein L24 [Planctomycetes bacterium]|nr:50S ribosomal protein L24 [Planctomycetota bacterium]
MPQHVKQGDIVMITAGNERGKTGKVLKVDVKNQKVVVEGRNVRQKHVRPSQANPQGGRVDKEMPIHISNVSPISPSANKPTRVRFETKADGSKVRLAVKGGDVLSTLKKAR